jgi:hypothetical protein
MFADLYMKGVLTVIAIALSIMAVNPWIAPPKIEAATTEEGVMPAILSTVNQIANGTCKNTKICGP